MNGSKQAPLLVYNYLKKKISTPWLSSKTTQSDCRNMFHKKIYFVCLMMILGWNILMMMRSFFVSYLQKFYKIPIDWTKKLLWFNTQLPIQSQLSWYQHYILNRLSPNQVLTQTTVVPCIVTINIVKNFYTTTMWNLRWVDDVWLEYLTSKNKKPWIWLHT